MRLGQPRKIARMNTRYRRRRAATAYHEAGHAVIAHMLGCQVVLVSIVRQGTTRGRAHSDSPGDPEQNAWILLAGPTAQWMSGYCTRRSVWRYLWRASDGEDLGELLDRVAASDAEKWVTCSKWVTDAEKLVKKHWHVIDRVARVLLEHRRLAAVQFYAALNGNAIPPLSIRRGMDEEGWLFSK